MAKYSRDLGYQAFRILQVAFVVVPIIAGIDKFFDFLINWSNYISPFVMQMIDYHDSEFMMFVGIVEIVAGIGIIFKPKIFSYIVAVWLLGIIINLLLTGHHFDIALRDLGLCLSAFAFAKLSQEYAAD